MNTKELNPNTIGDNLSKKDARELARWWNGNTNSYYFVRPDDNHPGRYMVVRSCSNS